jgi:hypothetical protein
MIAYAIVRALQRHGVRRYTIMTWQSRLFARHHRELLEAVVVLAIVILFFMFATVVVGIA